MSRPPRPTGPQPQTEERNGTARQADRGTRGAGDRRTRTDRHARSKHHGDRQRDRNRRQQPPHPSPRPPTSKAGAMSGTRRNRMRPPRGRDGKKASRPTTEAENGEERRDGEAKRDGTRYEQSREQARRRAGTRRAEQIGRNAVGARGGKPTPTERSKAPHRYDDGRGKQQDDKPTEPDG